MSKYYLLLTIALFLFLSSNSFSNTTDNILSELTGDNRLEKLNELSFELATTQPTQSEKYARDLLKLSSKEQFKYKGQAYFNLAKSYFYREMYDYSLKNYQLAEPYLQLASDSNLISRSLNNMALINFRKANYKDALILYQRSLKIKSLAKDSLGAANTYHKIGLIFGHWGKYEIQYSYFEKALKIYRTIGNKKQTANILLNLGSTTSYLEDYIQTKTYYKQALNLFEQLQENNKVASTLNDLGSLCYKTKEFDFAQQYYTRAKDIFEKSNNKTDLIRTYIGIGDILAARNQNKEAIKMYKKSEELNQQSELLLVQQENLFSLYAKYKRLGDFENATRILENYTVIKDSIYNTKQSHKILELENKYELQKNKNKVSQLIARNRLYVIIISVILFLLTIAVTYSIYHYRTKLLNEKQRLLQLEQKVLRTQMNPHFIFNSLSAIQYYILDNKILESVDFLADFAGLMRLILQYSQDEYISLQQEREVLEYYISMQNKRFGDKIKYNIVIDAELDTSKTMIPPMLAQPFIENSFEHGELYKKEDAEITIRFEKRNNTLSYYIEDNGIGLKARRKLLENKPKKHKSMAMQITTERLNLINRSNSSGKVHLNIEDKSKYGKEGTLIEFSIPLVIGSN